MKCPYMVNEATADTENGSVTVLIMQDCLEEECAAWEDGKCKRK